MAVISHSKTGIKLGDKVMLSTATAGGVKDFEKVKGGLKSNIEMTVNSIKNTKNGEFAECAWMLNSKLHSQEFPVSILVKK